MSVSVSAVGPPRRGMSRSTAERHRGGSGRTDVASRTIKIHVAGVIATGVAPVNARRASESSTANTPEANCPALPISDRRVPTLHAAHDPPDHRQTSSSPAASSSRSPSPSATDPKRLRMCGEGLSRLLRQSYPRVEGSSERNDDAAERQPSPRVETQEGRRRSMTSLLTLLEPHRLHGQRIGKSSLEVGNSFGSQPRGGSQFRGLQICRRHADRSQHPDRAGKTVQPRLDDNPVRSAQNGQPQDEDLKE